MSNPVVVITNSIPSPSDPTTERKSYTMKGFSSAEYFKYTTGTGPGDITAADIGQEFYISKTVGDALAILGDAKPDFVTTASWAGIRDAPSAIVTPVYSLMPKLICPSTLLVDNGLNYDRAMSEWNDPGIGWKALFNWTIDQVNGSPPVANLWFKYAHLGNSFGTQYITVNAKNDSVLNSIDLSMNSPAEPPTGDWVSSNMVGGGAFMLVLKIVPIDTGKTTSVESDANKWKMTISFGEVVMVLSDSSTMKVSIGDEETSVNLSDSVAKESPPQSSAMTDVPMVIGVYPCWNGLIVSSGQQETPEVMKAAGTFCRKLKTASIQSTDYSTWFDPIDPQDILVGTGSGATNVIVDMGGSISVSAENCRFEIAYVPRFFSKIFYTDGWIPLTEDSDEVEFDYNIYTIYTNNGTDYEFTNPPVITNSGQAGPTDDTTYWYSSWQFQSASETYCRYAGEVFSYVLETIAENKYSIKNGNGNFDLSWTGGSPGKTGAIDWKKYITNVSVTVGIDGSSGSVSVDKYGVAGQEAVAEQSIGAFVVYASGGDDTYAGEIFSGLAMGVSNSKKSGEASWTIPLIGLEKKLEDIALINPPFVDGETLASAMDFLCRYAGINYDLSCANATDRLSASTETNSVVFDWKSGTSVKSAIDDVMQDLNHWYVVMDGVLKVYALSDNGLPIVLGPDRSTGYDSTNMVSVDVTPDFEDLRNYIVAIALEKDATGQGPKVEGVPVYPMVEARRKNTIPDVPWAKVWVRAFPGLLTVDQLSDLADKMSKLSSTYEVAGRLTIPGNALIRPYDRWGSDYIVSSVTHNIDLVSKSWTTNLDFSRSAV